VKKYGRIQALDGVSAELDAGAIGLLGANGAGKTTLMKALLGVVRVDAGELFILGHRIGADRRADRARVGYMPERGALPLDMTAHDFVVQLAELRGLPRRAAALRASEVLFHVGLDEERGRLLRTYSTGMRQRAKLAQALIDTPELVILDEPTNGLDPGGRAEMLGIVRRLSQDLGIRVLMSSHVLDDVIATCDAVCVLRDGKVAYQGVLGALSNGSGAAAIVRVVGDPWLFIDELADRGLAASVRDGVVGTVEVAAGDDVDLALVRDAAVASGVGVAELGAAGPSAHQALLDAMR
jgi:ABC-2 type transport system ATP-binding protein